MQKVFQLERKIGQIYANRQEMQIMYDVRCTLYDYLRVEDTKTGETTISAPKAKMLRSIHAVTTQGHHWFSIVPHYV